MEVTECSWDESTTSGTCVVEKLGPLLGGQADFSVTPTAEGSRVIWREDITVRRLPRLLAPVAAQVGALGFRLAMWRLRRRRARLTS